MPLLAVAKITGLACLGPLYTLTLGIESSDPSAHKKGFVLKRWISPCHVHRNQRNIQVRIKEASNQLISTDGILPFWEEGAS